MGRPPGRYGLAGTGAGAGLFSVLPEVSFPGVSAPMALMTGEQYKESLYDGRSTFFEGKRVDDLPAHPILGSAVERVAEGYDWLGARAVDGRSPIMGVPTSAEELKSKVELVHHAGMMAHVTYTSIMTLATAAGRISEHVPQHVERMNEYI